MNFFDVVAKIKLGLLALLASSFAQAQGCPFYTESFEGGSGWNTDRARPIVETDGTGKSSAHQDFDMWSIDHYHAPPGGAGYLHLLMWFFTDNFSPVYSGQKPPKFITNKCSTNLTNATIQMRYRYEIQNIQNAKVYLWLQGSRGGSKVNYRYLEPLPTATDWKTVNFKLRDDPKLWQCMEGATYRPDYTAGCKHPVSDLLKDVNRDILLVLFPIELSAESTLNVALDNRPGRDFLIDLKQLPFGYFELDEFSINYPRK